MLGNQIKYYRQENKIKQEELAEFLGVSFQAVSKWETGASDPDIALLPKLAVYFGVTIDELFEMPYEEQMERIENMISTERTIKEKTFESAVAFLENRLKNAPKDTRALSNLAYLYNHRAHSDHELASYYAKRVLEADPDEKAGWVAYLEANGGVCGDKWYDNHFEVIRYFKEFLEKNPGNFLGLYGVLENLLADGRYEEAKPYIEEIKKAKKNHQYLLYCGEVAFGEGRRKEALEYWEKMVKDYPQTWQAYCSLGEGYQKMGMEKEALEAFETSFTMQEAPRIYDGLCSMAQIHEKQGELQLAIQDYERIIRCLKEDYHVTEGEQKEQYEREMKRLRRKLD